MKTTPDRNRRDLLNSAVVLVLFGWFVFNWYSTVAHILRYYNPLPVSDYWRVIEDLPAIETGDFGWLWRQHNEHRIIFPEIVFALDEVFLSGRQVLPLVVSFLCYAATVVVLGRAFWGSTDAPPRARAQALLLGGVIAGWPLSTFVLGTPFLLQWTLLQFAAVVAFASISQVCGEPGLRYLIISVGCGVVATFSSANGLLLWPILFTIAALLRAPRRYVIAIAVSSVASISLFFVGYQRPRAPVGAVLNHPTHWLGFVVSYFSMPFGVLRNPVFGLVFGVVSLTTWLVCLSHNLRRGPTSRYRVVAFGYLAFLLLTAILTSFGRVDLTDPRFLRRESGPVCHSAAPRVGFASALGVNTIVRREMEGFRAPNNFTDSRFGGGFYANQALAVVKD